MIHFILGIFTGIGIAILWGHYLNNQRKKENEHNRRVMKNVINAFDEMSQWKGFEKSIDQQLQDAIDREDFKEAARLRDLINKK